MYQFKLVQLSSGDSATCGNCGMQLEEGGGCCTNEEKLVKLNADQAPSTITIRDLFLCGVALSKPVSPFYFASLPIAITQLPVADDPPLAEDDLYLRNSIFRI